MKDEDKTQGQLIGELKELRQQRTTFIGREDRYRQAEEALASQEDLYRTLVEALPDIIWIADAEGCTFLNKAWRDHTGQEIEEGLGQGWVKSLHPDDAPEILAKWKRASEDGEPYAGECRFKAADGSYSSFDFIGVPVRDRFEKIVQWIGINRDVTKRKRLQEQLLQAQKLEMIGTLAGGVAHDFNNLLTAVQGNASLALIELPQDSPLRSAMHAIEDAASHGAALVKQMLAYAGEGKASREPVDVSELIERLGPLLATTVPDTVVIEYDLHNGLPSIMADPTQVRQVVINLMTNASEAIGDAEGTITASTGMLTHDADGSGSALQPEIPSGAYVYFDVSDTGVGMDAATQAKMWDPFFSTKFAGRGLGLAAVQGIVRSYGGATEVVSQPGRGTQVRTLFAVTEQALSQPPERALADEP